MEFVLLVEAIRGYTEKSKMKEYLKIKRNTKMNNFKKYSVIYADPPWNYNDKKCNGGVFNHYSTMSIKDIYNLPVKEHSRKLDEVHDKIVELMGKENTFIELFARQNTPGWNVWRNEINKFDISNVPITPKSSNKK